MSEGKKITVERLPAVRQKVGRCGFCEGNRVLAWHDPDVGNVCRECAAFLIQAEMASFFPGAVK